MKTLYSILLPAIVFTITVNAQELVSPFVIYTYDDAGNRVMAISSPGYLEAEPISSTSALSRDRTVDSIVVKPQKERISPQESVSQHESFAADDRKSRQRSKKKKHHDS